MKWKKFCSLLLALLLTLAAFSAGAIAPAPTVSSQAGLLLNLDTGKVLFSRSTDAPIAPSSLVKVMTALIVIENCSNLDAEVTVSSTAIADLTGLTTASLKAGEVMTVRNLLYCAVIRSAGDACNVLAEYTAGSVSAFVEMMNQKAAELGMANTTFTNPNGRDDDAQVTTIDDLAKLALYALENPQFMEICNIQYKYIPETNLTGKRYYYSSNYMIISNASQRIDDYYYKYATGMMAAHSAQAGYCLMTTAQKDGMSMLCIVAGAEKNASTNRIQSYIDAKALFEWSFENYQYVRLTKEREPVCEVDIGLSAHSDKLVLVTPDSFKALIPAGIEVSELTTQISTAEKIKAPVQKGQELGTVTYLYEGIEYASSPLVAASDVERNGLLFLFDCIATAVTSTVFRVVIAVIAALIVLYIILVINNNRRGGGRRRRRSGRSGRSSRYNRYYR